MDVKHLKEFVYENNRIVDILTELGMHHIRWCDGNKYITCAMPDGDNPSSTVIYNNEHFNVTAYTRNIKDPFNNSDLISLTCFVKKLYFSQAIKYLCDLCGLDYYTNSEEELPASILWMRQLRQMNTGINDEEEIPLKPIDDYVLTYYHQQPIADWIKYDGVSYDVQQEFEIGFDLQTERVTIPIRDDIGNLVGVKGRLWSGLESESRPKYMYLERCAKSQILYGLHKALPYIKQKGSVIVCESEKGVLQLWSQGYMNSVSLGGHSFSKTQLEKITRLDVSVIIAFDEDIDEIDVIIECDKFMDYVDIYYLMDKDNILGEKESPMDDGGKFKKLMENNKYAYVRS